MGLKNTVGALRRNRPFAGPKKGVKHGPKKPRRIGGAGSRTRDYRGPNGQLEDAEGRPNRDNQSTDNSQ